MSRSPDGNPFLGCNAALLVAKDESILMGTKYAAVGAALRRESEGFGRPIRRVLVTHHHTDHSGGNLAFTADIPVLAHARAKPRILAQLQRYTGGIEGTIAGAAKVPGEPAKAVVAEGEKLRAEGEQLRAEQFAPTQTVDADTNLENGGAKVQLRYFGPAHTDNDLAFFLPDANVLYAGDLVANKVHSLLDRPGGGTCAGWIETLGKITALCDAKTVVVPGHGEVTGVEGIKEQAAYLETVRGLVAEAVKAGKAREEVLKMGPPKAFEAFGLLQLFPLTLGALYDELTQK